MLYFHDATFYSKEKIQRSIEELRNVEATDKDGNLLGRKITVYIKHIICVTKEGLWEEYDL